MVQIVSNPGFGAKFSNALLPTLISSIQQERNLDKQKELLLEREKIKQASKDKLINFLKEKSGKGPISKANASARLLEDQEMPLNQNQGVTEEQANNFIEQAVPLYESLSDDEKVFLSIENPQLANLLEKQSQTAKRQDLAERQFTLEKKKYGTQQEQFRKTHELAKGKEERLGGEFKKTHELAEQKEQRLGEEFKQTNERLDKKYIQDLNESERKPLEKTTEAFFTKLGEEKERLSNEELSLQSMFEGIKSGEVDPFSSAHIAEIAQSFGAPESIVKTLKTPGSKAFDSGRKAYLSSILKDTFRGATTGKEIGLAESLISEVGVNRDANYASLFLLQANLNIKKEKLRLAREAQNKGISNYEIPGYVEDNLIPYKNEQYRYYIEAIRELINRNK